MSEVEGGGASEEERAEAEKFNRMVSEGKLTSAEMAEVEKDKTPEEIEAEKEAMEKVVDLGETPILLRNILGQVALPSPDELKKSGEFFILPGEKHDEYPAGIKYWWNPVVGIWASLPIPPRYLESEEPKTVLINLSDEDKDRLGFEKESEVVFNPPIRSTLKTRDEFRIEFEELSKAFIRNLQYYPDLIELHKTTDGRDDKRITLDFGMAEYLLDRILGKKGKKRTGRLTDEEFREVTADWDKLSQQYREWMKKSLFDSGIWLKYQRCLLWDRERFGRAVGGSGTGVPFYPYVLISPDVDWRVSNYQPHDFYHEIILPRDQGLKKQDIIGFMAEQVSDPKAKIDVLRTARALKVPYYDNKGGLKWPRRMTHEQVKQFVAERERKKKDKSKIKS